MPHLRPAGSLVAGLLMVLPAACGSDDAEPATAMSSSPEVQAGAEVGGERAVLEPASSAPRSPASSAPRSVVSDTEEGCRSPAGPGTATRCGIVSTSAGELAWLVEEERGASGALRAFVLEKRGDEWRPVLEAIDEEGTQWASVGVETTDLTDDGTDELIFGFRSLGSSTFLYVDVVDGSGRVVAHLSLDKGEVTVRPGRLDAWSARFGPDDPNCCPSAYLHETLEFVDDAWRVTSSQTVPSEEVPSGDF